MKKYFKYKLKSLALVAIWILIFVFTFRLYHLPVKAVLYPAVLCAVVGVLYFIIDSGHIFERHRLMTKLNNQAVKLKEDLAENCPPPRSISDEDYREMVALLCDAAAKAEDEAFRKYSDMMDYYTVWVHQIKTPIAAMRLNLQAQDSPEARQLLSDLNRIESYVTMVLTYLRLDSESTDYIIKEYDLDEIIVPTVKKFAGEFINKHLSLNFHGTGAKVVTDEKWLSFVLEQVISNAVKYTEKGSISIYLEGFETVAEDWDDELSVGEDRDLNESGPMILCIKDTGMGINTEDLPRIFENGYTGFNGRVDKRASGIGLYLCRRICTSLGHEIYAESQVGEGTTIKIKL